MRFGALLLTLTLTLLSVEAPAAPAGFGGQYESKAFAYELRSTPVMWLPWSDLEDDYPYADTGLLGIKGYGAVVMSVCWQGQRPAQVALLEVFMERFGEAYPTEFVHTEEPAARDGATGFHLVGTEPVDGEDYDYHFWIVANDSCGYTLSAWGPTASDDTHKDLTALWEGFGVRGEPAVIAGRGTPAQNEDNAYFLNQIGMHYFDARSYRDAFRYLSQATDLDTSEPTYVMNAMRVLTEIDAYQEAYDWLQPRLANYGEDKFVRSWDAWLAYQTNDTDKAIRVYDELFREGYREDDEFAVYAGMLADREQWAKLEADLAIYAKDGMTEPLQRLQADLLSRRGRYEEALVILDRMTEGRPFSADVAYSRIEVYDELDRPAEILQIADQLIANDYRSLESYFYKGYAEYQLKSYVEARESFRTAQKYSPTSGVVREYLDSINDILGEGENASISTPLAAVSLPPELQALVDTPAYAQRIDGYGAFFLNRITGFDFDGSDKLSKTWVQQIKVQDAQGIEQFSTLEFDFDPAFEQLFVNSLVVRDEQGSVIAEGNPASYYVTSTVDGYEASTEKTAHLPVPSLAPNVVIEVVATRRTNVDRNQFPLEIQYLSSSRPIGYSALFVSGKHDKLDYEAFGIGAPVKRSGALVWELAEPVVYRWEPLQPFYDRMLPWVFIGTTSTGWDSAGADYLEMIGDKLDPEFVSDTAERLVRGVDDDARRIEIISRYVQKELHYEAIEFGRRAYIPKTARETLRDRYGDCKDHAVLLYAMLRAVGVPAQLALVNLNQQVLPELPNIDQFDHMIVSVPVDGHRLYIDATDKDLSLGRTPPRHMAGNYALVLGESSELLEIPQFEVGDSGLQVEREIERMPDDELKVVEIGVFSGYQAADLRGQLRSVEASEMRATMQRWVASRYTDAIVDDAFVDNLFEADSELVVELHYRLPLDHDTFKMPGFFEAAYLDFDRLPERRFGFELTVPFVVSTVTTVKHPDTAKLRLATRKPDADESRFGSWQRRVDRNEDAWILQLEYTSSRDEYAPEDYGAFADFHRRLVGSIEQPVVLE